MPVSIEEPILTPQTAEKFIDENTIGALLGRPRLLAPVLADMLSCSSWQI